MKTFLTLIVIISALYIAVIAALLINKIPRPNQPIEKAWTIDMGGKP